MLLAFLAIASASVVRSTAVPLPGSSSEPVAEARPETVNNSAVAFGTSSASLRTLVAVYVHLEKFTVDFRIYTPEADAGI